MWFLLYWYLPAVITLFVTTLAVDRGFAVKDIFLCTMLGVFGWMAMIFGLWAICDTWGHVNLISLKKKD